MMLNETFISNPCKLIIQQMDNRKKWQIMDPLSMVDNHNKWTIDDGSIFHDESSNLDNHGMMDSSKNSNGGDTDG